MHKLVKHLQNLFNKIKSKQNYNSILILSLVFITILFLFLYFLNIYNYNYKIIIGIVILSFFLLFIPSENILYCDSDNESDNESDNDNNSHKSKTSNSNSNSNSNSMNKSSDISRISELESSKVNNNNNNNNNNVNKDVYTGSVTVDKTFTDMAVKQLGNVLIEGIGKVASEMGPYTAGGAAASSMAKATAGMAPGPRIATVSLTSAGTYIATKSAAIITDHFIKDSIIKDSTENSAINNSPTSSPIDPSFINSPLELKEITSPLEDIFLHLMTLNIGILLLILGVMLAILSKSVSKKNNSLFISWIERKLSKKISDRLTKIVSYFGELNDKFFRIMIIMIFLIIILFIVFNIYSSLYLYFHIDDFIKVHNFIHNENNKSVILFFLTISNLKTQIQKHKHNKIFCLSRTVFNFFFIFSCLVTALAASRGKLLFFFKILKQKK